jgi:hypothetical protein
MNLATKGNVSQQEKISPTTKRLGKGSLQKGWQKVKLWEKKLGSGKAIENIWEEMRQNDKKVFQDRN